ncbi:ATP-binding protein [Entomobacter blattae]|nr:ATP-binding protein [Entomobacter blattae]
MDNKTLSSIIPFLQRIASSLERLAPPPPQAETLHTGTAFLWQPELSQLQRIEHVAYVELDKLQGIDQQKQLVMENTFHFSQGLPANNTMLWGARGMGKSSLVKACHAWVNSQIHEESNQIVLIEIERDDLATLPLLLSLLRQSQRRFILFCDDLSFEKEDADYKALKSVLDGGIAGKPANVLFYATSNRRHLMPRDMIENERSTAISPSETIEEKVSLSDRFGLWIGFHNCSQETYLEMVSTYAKARSLNIDQTTLFQKANSWAVTRGARSGRVAYQFIEDLTARLHEKHL